MSLNLKHSHIRWFTLIEILFVIVIISLLLGSVFFFWSQRIAELWTKTHVEAFIQFYDRVRLENLSSSYIWTGRYDAMTLDFVDEQGILTLDYRLQWDAVYTEDFVLGGDLVFDLQSDFVVAQKPFAMWCTIIPTSAAAFAVVSPMGDRYCFAIIPDSCRLDTTLCPQ